VRVYYEDTDAGGVVYHSQYLNFLERARTEWLRHLGFEQTDLRDNLQVLIVVHSLQIAFKKPARFNDLLSVKCHLTALGNSSWHCAQTIWRDGELLIEAQVKAAFIHAHSFKPTRIPAAILNVAKPLVLNPNALETPWP
jgi:acyl-CoA thioester hydrolase